MGVSGRSPSGGRRRCLGPTRDGHFNVGSSGFEAGSSWVKSTQTFGSNQQRLLKSDELTPRTQKVTFAWDGLRPGSRGRLGVSAHNENLGELITHEQRYPIPKILLPKSESSTAKLRTTSAKQSTL
jgi:hypothetical protein